MADKFKTCVQFLVDYITTREYIPILGEILQLILGTKKASRSLMMCFAIACVFVPAHKIFCNKPPPRFDMGEQKRSMEIETRGFDFNDGAGADSQVLYVMILLFFMAIILPLSNYDVFRRYASTYPYSCCSSLLTPHIHIYCAAYQTVACLL